MVLPLFSSHSDNFTLPRTTLQTIPLRRQTLKLKINLPRQWRSASWSNRSRGQSRQVLPPVHEARNAGTAPPAPPNIAPAPVTPPTPAVPPALVGKGLPPPPPGGPAPGETRKLRPFPWKPRESSCPPMV